jgi:hypothetical protein
MSEEDLIADAKAQQLSPWQRHKFITMVFLAITIALCLVGVALALYASSGAAQLDLSRPGYVSVREQASQAPQFDGFSASGTIDKAALDQFNQLYDERAAKAVGVDSFGGTVMSDKALAIDSPQASE